MGNLGLILKEKIVKQLNIKTRHVRRYAESIDRPPFTQVVYKAMSEIRSQNLPRTRILPMGGYTQVAVYDGENKLGEETAYCSKHDHFNRKIGRAVALGQVMKQLKVEV